MNNAHFQADSLDEADTTLLPEGTATEVADEPTAVEDYGITAAEESHREPLSLRLRRELPDFPARRLDDNSSDVSAEEAAVHVIREG